MDEKAILSSSFIFPYSVMKSANTDELCLTYGARAEAATRSWGDEPENCRIEFAKLMKLSTHPDVKAEIKKVRGARGWDDAFKAESLAVERSG